MDDGKEGKSTLLKVWKKGRKKLRFRRKKVLIMGTEE